MRAAAKTRLIANPWWYRHLLELGMYTELGKQADKQQLPAGNLLGGILCQDDSLSGELFQQTGFLHDGQNT